ncbi:MAG: ABC transporter substrate-binding protein [Acidimicrobiia bacterium]
MAGLALIVACTAVPAPETTISTEAASTTVAPTTTTTIRPVPDPEFTMRVSVGCMPLFDLIIAELSIVECPEWGMPLQPSLYRLVPPTATLVPLLAADPTPPLGQATDDGWEIVVTLRQGVTWSDGTVVDAEDVVYTYQVLSDQAPWRFSYTVEAIDDFTVRYVWEERPTTNIWQFEAALAPIFSADFWGAQQERPEGGFGFTPDLEPTAIPTTGPYRLAEVDDDFEGWILEAVPAWWEAGSSFTVWRNGSVRYRNPNLGLDETYGEPEGDVIAEWTVGPYASRVEYSVFGGVNAEIDAFREGDIDLMLRSVDFPSGIPDLGAAAGLVRSVLGVDVVVFEFDAPPFDNVAVRRAAACAFDPQVLVGKVLPGKVLPPTGWGVGLGPWWEDASLDCEGVGTGNILEGVPVAGVLVRPPEYSPIPAAVAAAVYDWLAGLGAEPIDGFIEMGSIFDDDSVAEFTVFGLGIDPVRLITNPRVLIDTDIGWQPPEAVALLDQIRSAYDLETEQAAYRELQQLVADQIPAVPVLRQTMVEAFNTHTILPPFVTPTEDGYTTPLIGGLRNWESWVVPATRQAP